MFSVPLATSSNSISVAKFWDSALLYHERPHLVNRKLTAVSQALFCEVEFHSKSIKLPELINKNAVLHEVRKLEDLTKENISVVFLKNLLESYDKNVNITPISIAEFKNNRHGVFVSVRILFPRLKNCQKAVEVVILNKNDNYARFLNVTNQEKLFIAPPFPYDIELSSNFNLRINVDSFDDADTTHAEWLADKLFSKLLKWIEDVDESKRSIQSLSLIDVDEYCLNYNRLKQKYGEQLVSQWPSKTGTDPQKYVYEDIAIASYLICLWKDQKDINFVDLGCGNGLLVHLLNEEGFQGHGIDIRKRQIWDIYPKTTSLKVDAVIPDSTFPNATCLIGNHSDELTPWIPIIALKSGQNTNFFVLPCCPFDFSGKKYIRKNTSQTVYSEYVGYIQDICQQCGFDTNIDKLRIPSTRRICLVGIQNSENYPKNLKIADQIVKTKTDGDNNFVQRSNIEKVRNCTQLERPLITKIVKSCVNTLLSNPKHITKLNGDSWNQGSSLKISELVNCLEKEDLKKLKQECGGLQTLLKNHKYIFEFKDGFVNLRLPVKLEESTKYKDKPCWFLTNHPQGCLYIASVCGYQHQ